VAEFHRRLPICSVQAFAFETRLVLWEEVKVENETLRKRVSWLLWSFS
jgi:hypothetical protein